MKIVNQSAQIIEPMDSVIEQIAEAGKVCYQVDEVKGGPENFLKRIIERKHWSVLEMASVTLMLEFSDYQFAVAFQLISSKYMDVDIVEIEGGREILIVTASIRTWREWVDFNMAGDTISFILPIYAWLKKHVAKMGIEILDSRDISVAIAASEIYSLIDGVDVEKECGSVLFPRHLKVMVKLVTNRAVSHEIVRHRPCSFLQESQRYCRYGDDRFGNEVTFISPEDFFAPDSTEYALWERHCSSSEQLYLKLLKDGHTPQAARTVLPNSTKTELIVYANLEQWKHIFSMRAENKAAEPSMRALMIPLQEEFKARGWL